MSVESDAQILERRKNQFYEKYRKYFTESTGAYPPQFYELQQKCINPIIKNDKNLLICAPTGSGKTLVMEMSMLHAFDKFKAKPGQFVKSNFKVVYLAPTKAVC